MTQVSHMTLDDLKTGMIVTTRNGREYTVLRDVVSGDKYITSVFIRGSDGWMKFEEFQQNLKSKINAEYDIVKIEIHEHPFGAIDLKYHPKYRIPHWEERHAVKLTVAEIEARLGYKIEIVSEEE